MKININKTHLIFVFMFIFLVLSFLGPAYSWFSYNQDLSINLGTMDIENTVSGTTTISITNLKSERISEARRESDNYIDFTLTSKNNYQNTNMYYYIKLHYGNNISGKTRIDDGLLVFDLEKTVSGTKTKVIDSDRIPNTNGYIIYKDTLAPQTNSKVINFRLRIWVKEGETDLTNKYANFRVEVVPVYFDPTVNAFISFYDEIPTAQEMLINNALPSNQPSEYVTTAINFGNISSDTNGKGLYMRAGTENDEYPVVYYRGAVNNNNMLFANFCWKIVRTTEKGGVKLIYNGAPSNGECTNTTGSNTQIGTTPYSNPSGAIAAIGYMYGTDYANNQLIQNQMVSMSRTMSSDLSLSTDYYYADSIEYNTIATNKYSLVNPYKVSSTSDYPNLAGKYTFRSNDSSYTYESVYYIANVSNSRMHCINLKNGNMLSYYDNIKFGDTLVNNGNNTYSIKMADNSNLLELSLSDWYTDYANYKDLYTCDDIVNYAVLGSGYSQSSTCVVARKVTDTGNYYYSYVDTTSKIYAKSHNNLNLIDTLSISGIEWYNNISNNPNHYDEYKYTCNDNLSTCTKDKLRLIHSYEKNRYYYVDNYYFGSSISWNGTSYSLNNAQSLDILLNMETLSTHHYFCLDKGETTCTQAGYLEYYNLSKNRGYYIKLENGITSIDSIISSAKTNTNNSTIKSIVDNWYQNNMMSYTNLLEDSVYCNDRRMNVEGNDISYTNNGLTANGGYTYNEINFQMEGKTRISFNPDFTCEKNDAFTVNDTTNGNGNLTYPIALLINDEFMLAGGSTSIYNSSYYLYTNSSWWTMSPSGANFSNSSTPSTYIFTVYNSGSSVSVGHGSSCGIRPVITINPNMVNITGTGISTDPYVAVARS